VQDAKLVIIEIMSHKLVWLLEGEMSREE